MTEKEHGKPAACAGEHLDGEPAERREALKAQLAAVLPTLGSQDEMPAVTGERDEVDRAALAQEAHVLGDALAAQPPDSNSSFAKAREERLIKLVGPDGVEGEHEVAGDSLDRWHSYLQSLFSGEPYSPNRTTAFRRDQRRLPNQSGEPWLAASLAGCAGGAVGAVAVLALERLLC